MSDDPLEHTAPIRRDRPAKPTAAQQATDTETKGGRDAWGDQRDQWSKQIDAAHPIHTGRHDAYMTAMEMVGNRHSKSELVNLVCWLLQGQHDAK